METCCSVIGTLPGELGWELTFLVEAVLSGHAPDMLGDWL